ncbi:hypothetical protein DBR32_00710 [Taibaiella sp. KBW10]|uniref:DUF3658 domain-containing protein n=1 Tax=Taibaiella sp. KBW10 TaxID=2153357 RepID=UPI000F59AA0F|nr:DUF3658 domain-containing protein [Taibaiella sp. KBW10]RQO32168.1 hypothetical protein DBR32_00710 [Taibaiella sp. KBW10]
MKLVHIVVGDFAAQTLHNAFNQAEIQDETVLVIKDVFNVGPLRSEELKFSELRAQFWQEVSGQEKEIVVDDLDRLMQLSTQLTNEEVDQAWFWMSPIPADVCTYFWLLHFLKKHMGKLHVININGLPFLDEEGKLFYPESISALPQRQVLKAKKLARPITPSEWETEGDEWKRLIHEEQVGIRINEGGRKIVGKAIDFYDKALLEACTAQNQKITKLLAQVMAKHKVYTGDTFLLWRLRTLARQHAITITKDSVKLFDGNAELSDINEAS